MILSRRNSEEEEDLVEGEEETDRLPRSGDAKQGLGQAEAARSPEGPEAGETKLAAASSGGGVLGGLTASLSFLGQTAAFRSPQAYALEKLTGFYFGSGEAIGAGGTEEEGMTGGQVGESKGGEERQKEHTQQYQTPV
uniref:Uncharacterized protein n=1 Tax=Heterosigma akashiwo TaxID=2829 RepID=A0A7S4DLR2_HETAK